MLTEFSPKILRFIYELSKLEAYKSSIELAKSLRLNQGHSVTPKTIRNWFQYLRSPYSYGRYHVEERLSYYPGIFKNKLGLKMVRTFYEDPSEELVGLFPQRNYVGWLYNPRSNRPVLTVEYLIPAPQTDDFLALVNEVKTRGLCADLSTYITGPSCMMVAPLHEVIDCTGVFHPEKHSPADVRMQVESFYKFLQSDMTTEISPAIRRNPLIIPVLIAYQYENRTSTDVWLAIKHKLKDSVWDYARQCRKKSDGVGIKKVQAITRDLKELGLLNQMRVVYFPIEIGCNVWMYTVLNFESKGDLIHMAETILANSIFCNLFPLGDNNAMIISLVNTDSLQNLFGPLAEADVERLYFFDYFKSMDLVTTTRYVPFDHTRFFDPIRCKWVYDHDGLLSELDGLSR